MSAPGQDPMVPVTLDEVLQALLRGMKVMAENAATDTSGAEAKDYGAAAKSLADAYVVIDPARLQGGDTPDARKAAEPPRPATRDTDRDGKIGEK